MKYERVVKGEFISRPNRFVARVKVNGKEETVHVKNTGRCRELLVPGATVYLEDFTYRMGSRKMAYSLIGVEKGNLMINMDSQAPNKVVNEALKSGKLLLPGMDKLTKIKPESSFGASRFDFYVKDEKGTQAYAEVKGVTLENSGIASFPDAPTERGIKHLNELCLAKEQGYEAYIIFVVQMEGMKLFTPNDTTHKAFGDALRKAESRGVKIIVKECRVGEDSLEVSGDVPYRL